MAYRDVVLADSPAIYLELEETSGTPANSGSETLSSAVVGSGVTYNVTGKAGKAYSFNGTTSANIAINDIESKYTDRVFSVELWVKTSNWSETFCIMNPGNPRYFEIRSNGSAQTQAFISGSSANVTLTATTPALWDGAWHHIVFVVGSSTDHRLYVDGTLAASSTTDIGLFATSGLLYVGSNLNGAINGQIDEFAVYDSALTGTRVSAHYNGFGTSAGYTAQAMTASADIVAPSVTTELNGAYTAQAMTASATSVDPTVTAEKSVSNAADAMTASATSVDADVDTLNTIITNHWANPFSSDGGVNGNTVDDDLPTMQVSSAAQIFIKATLGLPSNAVINRAQLVINTSNTGVMSIKKVDADFDLSTIVWSNKPTTSTSGDSDVSFSGSGRTAVDVTNAVQAMVSGTSYGIALTLASGTGITVVTEDGTTPSQRPVLALSYSIPTSNGGYDAQAATASADIVTAAFEADVAPVSGAMTADADMFDATVVVPDFTAFVDPMLADADMGQDSGYSANKNVNVSPVTTDADMFDAVVTTELNALYQAQVMPASGTMVSPLEAQGETADPYFQRLEAQVLQASFAEQTWYRLDETSGTAAENRVGTDGIYRGSPTFGGFGPEGRRVVGFDGINDYIGISDTDRETNQVRIEFVFRTDKEDQILVRGIDFIFNNVAHGTSPSAGQGLDMVGGKIRMYNMPLTQTGAFTGRTYLADNNWHHLVLTIGGGGTMAIYIDGVLEMRRFQSFSRFTLPDAFGGGPSFIEGAAAGPDDASQYFRGELMEFVVDAGPLLSEKDIALNYYAAFGIIPVEVEVATASASMLNAIGKGNQQKALGLFYSLETDENLDLPNYNDVYNWSGLRTSDNVTGIQRLSNTGSPSFDMAGYKVFPKSIIIDEYGDSGYVYDYYNPVTGEQEFINLAEDIDMSDYDLVFFINLPPRFETLNSNTTEQTITFNGRFDAMWERMMDGIREAQDEHGFSIWAPQPEVALGLGVINDYDVHSMRREVNPRGPMTPFGQPGNGDYDTRALNKERVVATVAGLTDFGGWILEDYIFGFGPTNGANYQPPNEAWNYVERPSGLLIGDELYYSQDFYNALGSASWFSGGAHNQRRTVISVPSEAVLAGTVVTRENLNHWVGNSLVENPWKDNAVSIVVAPGDPLKGRPVNGKIYVNFMDSIDGQTPTFKKQIVPPNENLPLPSDWETPEMREWEYSSTRVSRVGTTVSGTTVQIGDPQMPSDPSDAAAWATYQFQLTLANLQRSGSIIVVSENEKYPTTYLEHYPMISRAFAWLRDREEIQPGDKVVRVPAMTASAEMPEIGVVGQKDASITTDAAVANATMESPDEVADPDATILVLPMTALAEMTGYAKNIDVSPMEAFAEMVENFDEVHAGGEQVVLYLHYTDATVYLKEDL